MATAIHFEHTRISRCQIRLFTEVRDSSFTPANPWPGGWTLRVVHILVLSDGLTVNGSEPWCAASKSTCRLGHGYRRAAGDGDRFEETLTLWDTPPARIRLPCRGFYALI